jgi:protein-disulfide isomerase
VRIVYKHLAILGPESTDSAVAAECAADQGKFWEYHDVLFSKQTPAHNSGAFTKANLIQYGKDLGLDMARFEPCVNNNETLARVQADMAEAASVGFNATPSFVIGDYPFVGAQPFANFAQIIDQKLGD